MNTESQVLNIPIEDIIPNRFQPRISFDESSLQELASSIKEHGIIQPLVLRRVGDKYEIIAGERRYKAAKIAGLTSVPAIISLLNDAQSAEVAIVENVQRKDLSAIEEARSYKALLDKGYLTQEELAKKMGLSQSAISNKLRLLSLSNEVQQALMDEKISERHARSLLKIEDHKTQNEWLKKIIDERLTVRALDNQLKNIIKPEEEVEIPLVEKSPSVEEIKANSTDINEVKEPQQPEVVNTGFVDNVQKAMPNKFFNFLEDEQVNMGVEETKNEPVVEEEIEMLDFEAPTPVNEKPVKDFTEASTILNNAITELENKGFKAKLQQVDEENNIKFIIDIDKSEE